MNESARPRREDAIAAPSEVMIVPCVAGKVWDTDPALGNVPAQDAYTERRFLTWRRHAEGSGLPWFILSTKYGLVRPSDLIAAYNRGVMQARADRTLAELLTRQGRELGLVGCKTVHLLDYDLFIPLVRALVGPASTIEMTWLTMRAPTRW